eukprot:360246-Chlamydomonas_euryale.AAC.4
MFEGRASNVRCRTRSQAAQHAPAGAALAERKPVGDAVEGVEVRRRGVAPRREAKRRRHGAVIPGKAAARVAVEGVKLWGKGVARRRQARRAGGPPWRPPRRRVEVASAAR